MKVFVTGPTGYIGRALVRELVDAGHEVTGLLRSADKRNLLSTQLGAVPVFGDLGIPASYRSLAQDHDALIHAGFQATGDTVGVDRTALDALLDAARIGDRPSVVVYTSGCWVLGDTGGSVVDESAPTDAPADVVAWRPAHERIVLDADDDDVATAVVRPGVVYGGGGGLTADFFASAEEDGAAGYVEDGDQRWSLVHREDLPRLYRLILERGASGVFHGVDGQPVPVVEAARAASRAAGAGGDVREISMEAAREEMGGVADALAMDQRLEAPRSAELGWTPERASFVEAAPEAYREWKAQR